MSSARQSAADLARPPSLSGSILPPVQPWSRRRQLPWQARCSMARRARWRGHPRPALPQPLWFCTGCGGHLSAGGAGGGGRAGVPVSGGAWPGGGGCRSQGGAGPAGLRPDPHIRLPPRWLPRSGTPRLHHTSKPVLPLAAAAPPVRMPEPLRLLLGVSALWTGSSQGHQGRQQRSGLSAAPATSAMPARWCSWQQWQRQPNRATQPGFWR